MRCSRDCSCPADARDPVRDRRVDATGRLSPHRQITIAAPAAAIFPRVNDLRQWDDWSPWAKLDPNAKISFEGPLAGPGAMFHWSGNDKVGAGTMTITESKPNERIATRTDFMKPFEERAIRISSSRRARSDQCDLDDERDAELHRQGDLPGDEHGADARPDFEKAWRN